MNAIKSLSIAFLFFSLFSSVWAQEDWPSSEEGSRSQYSLIYEHEGIKVLEKSYGMWSSGTCIEKNGKKNCHTRCGRFPEYVLPDKSGFFCRGSIHNDYYYDIETETEVDIFQDMCEKTSYYFENGEYDCNGEQSVIDYEKFISPDGKLIFLEETDTNGFDRSSGAGFLIDVEKLKNLEPDYLRFNFLVESDLFDETKLKSTGEVVRRFVEEVVFEKWNGDGTLQVRDREQHITYDPKRKKIIKETPTGEVRFFEDLKQGDTYYHKARDGWERGIVKGYADHTFRAEERVKRAEFAKMLIIAFEETEGKQSDLSSFSDISEGSWYEPYIGRAVELGLMEGYPDGMMRPGGEINKAEAYKMVVNMVKHHNIPFFNQFKKIPWYNPYLGFVKRLFSFDEKSPQKPLTLESMREVFNRGKSLEIILEAYYYDLRPMEPFEWTPKKEETQD